MYILAYPQKEIRCYEDCRYGNVSCYCLTAAQLKLLERSCGEKVFRRGYVMRSYITSDGTTHHCKIPRIATASGKSHEILPSFLAPYKRHLLLELRDFFFAVCSRKYPGHARMFKLLCVLDCADNYIWRLVKERDICCYWFKQLQVCFNQCQNKLSKVWQRFLNLRGSGTTRVWL